MNSNFIEHLLEHTKEYESSSAFWKWSGYTAVGAVLRDNCYRRVGEKKICANIYTLLLAPSAEHRKGSPVELCETLVEKTHTTKVISGRASIQGVLDELARGETDRTTGQLILGGSAIFSATELSAGIVNDPEAIKILTDIYEYKEEYTSRLRGTGVFRIKNNCLSMLAASNEDMLKDIYDATAIFGGLLGRTFLIKPDEWRPGNSLWEIPDQENSRQELVTKLAELARLRGEFTFSREAQGIYDEWYYPFREHNKTHPDRSGITGRFHTSILKIAMILCTIRTKSLQVLPSHIKEALETCLALLPNYQGFIMSGGKSTVSECAATLIEAIWTARGREISKQNFLSQNFQLYDLDLLDKTISTLLAADLLKLKIDMNFNLNGVGEKYILTEKCQERFNLK